MGMTGSKVFHTATSPNEIVILTDWPTAENARAYSQSPDLKQAMQKAGVINNFIYLTSMDIVTASCPAACARRVCTPAWSGHQNW